MNHPQPGLTAGNHDEWRDFEARHPAFREALGRLKVMMEAAFLRAVEGNDGKLVIFGLGRLAVEDFFEVLLLTVNGYGFGALKLLRPLYERVVTAIYLMEHPGEVQDFVDFAYVHQRKLLNHARMSGTDIAQFLSGQQAAAVEAEYKHVKARFTETLCGTCATTRDQGSWTKKDLKTQADEVGLGHLYPGAAFWPTMQLHTTRTALDARLELSADGAVFKAGPQRKEADQALGYAHILIVHLLWACNRFFDWGLDPTQVMADLEACRGTVGTGPVQPSRPDVPHESG